MIAVDTNVLVYAYRQDNPHHAAALEAVEGLVRGGRPWLIPYPCIHEFLSIVTHPRIYDPPSPMEDALSMFAHLRGTGTVTWATETDRHLDVLEPLLLEGGVAGPKVHDARIAAICLGNGVRELWTADRDFSFFPTLRTRNPLVHQAPPPIPDPPG